MAYILDADWAIQALKGDTAAVNTLVQLTPHGIGISWITVGEIYEGAFGFPDPQTHLATFREFLGPLHKLHLNDPIMEQFATIRADLRRRGQIIADFDILLAATALHHDLTVLTYNVRHFNRVPDLKLYQSSP